MIVEKSWEKITSRKGTAVFKKTQYRDVYTGWFLFGLFPLYIKRESFKR